jgi:hypothetical protein
MRRDRPEGQPDSTSAAVTVAHGQPAPGTKWWPQDGVRVCSYCNNRPDHLQYSARGKWLPHEASGIVHMAVCPGRRRNQRPRP